MTLACEIPNHSPRAILQNVQNHPLSQLHMFEVNEDIDITVKIGKIYISYGCSGEVKLCSVRSIKP